MGTERRRHLNILGEERDERGDLVDHDRPEYSMDIGEAIDAAILEFTETGQLSPRAQIAFEGHSFELDVVRIPEDHEQQSLPVIRNIRTAPLEGLFHRKENAIERYQYLAGCRFRIDWTGSQISPMRAVDVAQATLYATAEVMKAYRNGYSGKGAGAPLRAVAGIMDSRLDAMSRVGDALGAISNVSGWLAVKVLGEEWSLTKIAKSRLGWDDRYAANRTREMLDELARHYRMIAGARRQRHTNPRSR